MQHRIIHIPEADNPEEQRPVTCLSFRPFLDYIRMRMNDKESIKREIYQLVLDKFSKYPELEGVIPIEDTGKYKELLHLLYIVLSTVMEDEKKVLWGLSMPVNPILFYGSDALYNFLFQSGKQTINSDFLPNRDAIRRQKMETLYSYLLDHFYNFSFGKKEEMIRSVVNSQTQLVQHYRIHLDTRFVKVTANKPLPELNLENLQIHLYEEAGLELLERILPMNMFRFEGFSVITITDETPHYAMETIKDILVASHGKTDENSYDDVVQALKSMTGTNELEFNLLPLFRVNGKLVQDIDAYCHSIIFSIGKQKGILTDFFLPLIEKFITNPRIIYFRDLESVTLSQQNIGELLRQAGLKSYALIPVYFSNRLVGAFEVYTRQKNLLDERVFTRIEPAMPLIAQLMENSIDEFNNKLTGVVRDKFTSIQPAVQWRFNEAAWNYLYQTRIQEKPAEIEKIEFKDVYPLYGAIDMRNSTIERNKALLSDLRYQFSLLQKLFDELGTDIYTQLADDFRFQCEKWQIDINDMFSANDEMKLNQFFNEDVHPFLKQLSDSKPEIAPAINQYFDEIDPNKGKAWDNRRQLEESMQLINTAVNNYLDLMNIEIQQAHPCYFEKFRTDGVEYDIYIGQSINPDKPFDVVYLKNLRLWQLASMAGIAKLSHALVPQMKVPLQTTQLIFIYSHTIDISFRNDERRFDVEGGYNIRYHVIKKRIDKVLVKQIGERLTQPGKIAMVYYNQKDADEYVSYINHLQEKKILANDLEWLDLEELQGVRGLKALRVGIVIAND